MQQREIEARIVGPLFRAFAREIGETRAREILAILPPFVTPVALFVDAPADEIRRTTDALRPVLERTRGDLTTTILQQRLQRAIEGRLPD